MYESISHGGRYWTIGPLVLPLHRWEILCYLTSPVAVVIIATMITVNRRYDAVSSKRYCPTLIPIKPEMVEILHNITLIFKSPTDI